MFIVPIAWLYVALMMGVVEATSANGSVLGGVITFVLYGLAPVALVLYLMRTPARRRALRQREALLQRQAAEEAVSTAPDAGGHAATAAEQPLIPPVREKA